MNQTTFNTTLHAFQNLTSTIIENPPETTTLLARMSTLALGAVGAIAGTLALGCVYQFIATKIDEKRFPAPGTMIDIGGYRLHLHSSGEDGPSVILDAGMGSYSMDWALVQPEVAKFAHVYSFDRAGCGWSDERPNAATTSTSQTIVEELHTLLSKAGVPGPYILVGHSFGGMNARLFASKYPNEVAGIVLVDAGHEDIHVYMPPNPIEKAMESALSRNLILLASYVGLGRLFCNLPSAKKSLQNFPEEVQKVYLVKRVTAKAIKALLAEATDFKESCQQLKQNGGLLGDKPLIVITAAKNLTTESGLSQEFIDKSAKAWKILQQDLVTKSSNGKQIFAENSGHMIPYEQPQIIVDAIREIYRT